MGVSSQGGTEMEYVEYRQRLAELRREYALRIKQFASWLNDIDLIDQVQFEVDNYRSAVRSLATEYAASREKGA